MREHEDVGVLVLSSGGAEALTALGLCLREGVRRATEQFTLFSGLLCRPVQVVSGLICSEVASLRSRSTLGLRYRFDRCSRAGLQVDVALWLDTALLLSHIEEVLGTVSLDSLLADIW